MLSGRQGISRSGIANSQLGLLILSGIMAAADWLEATRKWHAEWRFRRGVKKTRF